MSSEEPKIEQSPQPTPPPSYHHRDEKDEKDEKDRESSEKDEKFTRDPLSGVLWAIFFIVAGLLLLGSTTHMLPFARWDNTWQVLMAAAGVTLLLEAVLRLLLPAYRRPILGNLIGGLILLSIGLGGVFDLSITWPVILIVVGVAILVGGLFRGRV